MAPIVLAAIVYNLIFGIAQIPIIGFGGESPILIVICFSLGNSIVSTCFSIAISVFIDTKLSRSRRVSPCYVLMLSIVFTLAGLPIFWLMADDPNFNLLYFLGSGFIGGMTGYGVWSTLHLCIRSAERAIAQERRTAVLREAMLNYENETLNCTLDSGFFIDALVRIARALKEETGVFAGEIVMSLAERMRAALTSSKPSTEQAIDEVFAESIGRADRDEISNVSLKRWLTIGTLGVWGAFFCDLFSMDIVNGRAWWKALSDFGAQSIVGVLWFVAVNRILRRSTLFCMRTLIFVVFVACVLGVCACAASFYLSFALRGASNWPPLIWYVFGFELFYVAPIFTGWGAIHVLVEARRREIARLNAAAEIREAALNARNALLRLQLNPHFLFNTLNALYVLILDRQFERARGMIAAVRRFLDRAGDPASGELVALSSELATQDAYLEIERVRFGDRLRVERRIDAEVAAAKVPHLILQPLVENAVKYAVARTDLPVAVEIRAQCTGRELVLTVADTGAPEAAPRPPGLGVGLRNVEARLKGLYGEAGRLACRPLEPAGFLAEVRLPLSL